MTVQTFEATPDARPVPFSERCRLGWRAAQFWARVSRIYTSYKWMQARSRAMDALGVEREAAWRRQHETAAKAMYDLCTDMRGFLIKAGQFLATRADFLPEPFIRRLSKLHAEVEPIPSEEAQRVIMRELGIARMSDYFLEFEDQPLGAASIAQVHRARLRRGALDRARARGMRGVAARDRRAGNGNSGEWVAIKVQYPGAEHLMMSDLASLLILARFLQNRELPFDLESPVLELQAQIQQEFDFVREANNTERVRDIVQRSRMLRSRVRIPRVYLAQRRVMVMQYLQGMPILRLAEEYPPPLQISARQQRAFEESLYESMSMVYGKMLLGHGFFQADPHPGNILLLESNLSRRRRLTSALQVMLARRPSLQIGLVDFGQCKHLPSWRLAQVRRLMKAMHQKRGICEAFFALGIALEHEPAYYDRNDIEVLAYSMFDTRPLPGDRKVTPFGEESPLRDTPVRYLPGDLFFVLRTIQILRGLQSRMSSPKVRKISLASEWCGRHDFCGK